MRHNVFTLLGVLMMGFGIFIGLVFPFFIRLVGIPETYVMTPLFFTISMAAGLFVGGVNVIFAKTTVQQRMTQLAHKMTRVETLIQARDVEESQDACNAQDCLVDMPSSDAIGDVAQSFNTLVKSLMQSFSRDDAIRVFNQTISAKLELDDLAPKALSAILSHVDAVAGALLVEQHGELILLSQHNLVEATTLTQHPAILRVFQQTQSERISLPKDIQVDAIITHVQAQCILVLPIVYKSVSMGVLVLASMERFAHDLERDLEYFMPGLSLALKNAMTHSQLQQLAANDPLTRVYNRRFGLMRLQEEYSRATRQDLPFGLLMCDIDHFKSFNDTYGHLLGDRVLIQVASAIKDALREGDVLMRYGGEEFLAVLPGASLKDTHAIADKIRRVVEDTTIYHQEQTLQVTISIGFTSYPHTAIQNVSQAIDIADKALYRAKENGRNRVESQ